MIGDSGYLIDSRGDGASDKIGAGSEINRRCVELRTLHLPFNYILNITKAFLEG